MNICFCLRATQYFDRRPSCLKTEHLNTTVPFKSATDELNSSRGKVFSSLKQDKACPYLVRLVSRFSPDDANAWKHSNRSHPIPPLCHWGFTEASHINLSFANRCHVWFSAFQITQLAFLFLDYAGKYISCET